MSWNEVVPEAISHSRKADLTLAVTPGNGFMRRRLIVTMRPQAFAECKWLKPAALVKLLIGTGEHAGILRIQPGGMHRVSKPSGGKHEARLVQIHSAELVAALPIAEGGHKATPCEFEWKDGWIEVTLPAWARMEKPLFRGIAQREGVAGVPSAPIPTAALVGGARR